MGNILGEGFNNYVRKQVNNRQKIHGSGADSTFRTPKEISYLNSRNAWIKIASSVLIEDSPLGKERLKRLGLENEFHVGDDLAKNFVLFNGISKLHKDILQEREGIWNPSGGDIKNNKYNNKALYGGIGQDFGLAPTPGIVDVNVENINNGSLKQAKITLKAYNKHQLDIIDLLYLRLGYTLLVEYGHSSYVNNKDNITTTKNTILENSFFTNELEGKTYLDLLPLIEDKRFESGGNYDAFFGRITNYHWDFQPDGSYNITIDLFSLGDVIESLQLNLSPGISLIGGGDFGKMSESEIAGLNQTQQKSYQAWLKSKDSNDLVVRHHMDNKIASYFMDIRNWNTRQIYAETSLVRDTEIFVENNIEEIKNTLNEQSKDTVVPPSVDKINQVVQSYEKQKSFEKKLPPTNDEGVPLVILDLPTGNFKLNPIITDYDDITEAEEWLNNLKNKGQNSELFGSFFADNGFINTVDKDFKINYKERDFTLKLRFYQPKDITSNNESYIGTVLEKNNPTSVTSTGKISYWVKADALNEDGGTIYGTTKYSLNPQSGYASRVFDPNLPLLNNIPIGLGNISAEENLGIFYNNMPPYIHEYRDIDIANYNEKLILEAYNKAIEEEEEKNKQFSKEDDSQFEEGTIGKADVLYSIQNKQKPSETLKVNYGKVINRREGWLSTGLYSQNSIFADHYYSPTTPPEYQYYIRFGTFLGFLRDKQVYHIESKNPFNPPIVDIDTDIDSNIMYTLPNHVSLDPRVCIVNMKMSSFDYITTTFENLEEFQNTTPFYGKLMNIYLNQQFVMQTMLNNMDSKGNIYFYNIINKICQGINRSLGGVNNLRPVIDESVNCLKIIDTSTIPNIEEIIKYLINKDPNKYKYQDLKGRYEYTKNTLANGDIPYKLDLFGYSKNLPKKGEKEHSTSNFVQGLSMRTEISSDLATIIAIGATKSKTVAGMNNTPVGKWNIGLVDKLNTNIITEEDKNSDPDKLFDTPEFEQIRVNYSQFLIDYWSPADSSGFMRSYPGANVSTLQTTLNPTEIDKNVITGTNFFNYLIQSSSFSNTKDPLPSANVNGFLPINMDITLDGISGMKIYQEIVTDNSFLPNNYPRNLKYMIVGLSNALSKNKWTTHLRAISQPVVKDRIKHPQLISSLEDSFENLERELINTAPLDPPNGKHLHEGRVAWVQTSGTSTIDSNTKSDNIRILIQEMNKKGITSPATQIGLLCVIGKESSFIPQAEKSWGGTGIPRIRKYFSARVAKYSDAQLEIIKKDPKQFFEVIYGPEAMPYYKNRKRRPWDPGNDQPGDGYKYRGKGFNQITFKAIYKKYSKKIGVDLVANPELMMDPKIAAKVAVLFLKGVMINTVFRIWAPGAKINELSIPDAILWATTANAGGGKDIRGTETYDDAKAVGRFFWILDEEPPSSNTPPKSSESITENIGKRAQANPYSPINKM
jgi:predicted chitinase